MCVIQVFFTLVPVTSPELVLFNGILMNSNVLKSDFTCATVEKERKFTFYYHIPLENQWISNKNNSLCLQRGKTVRLCRNWCHVLNQWVQVMSYCKQCNEKKSMLIRSYVNLSPEQQFSCTSLSRFALISLYSFTSCDTTVRESTPVLVSEWNFTYTVDQFTCKLYVPYSTGRPVRI